MIRGSDYFFNPFFLPSLTSSLPPSSFSFFLPPSLPLLWLSVYIFWLDQHSSCGTNRAGAAACQLLVREHRPKPLLLAQHAKQPLMLPVTFSHEFRLNLSFRLCDNFLQLPPTPPCLSLAPCSPLNLSGQEMMPKYRQESLVVLKRGRRNFKKHHLLTLWMHKEGWEMMTEVDLMIRRWLVLCLQERNFMWGVWVEVTREEMGAMEGRVAEYRILSKNSRGEEVERRAVCWRYAN